MARKAGDTPAFWIIAGPNGSGKSTLYGSRRDAVYGNTIISDATRPFWIKKGGHGVPIGKIRERWLRSLAQLPWFLNQADWALLLDNSEDLRIVGRKEQGKFFPGAPGFIRLAVQKSSSGQKK